MSNFYKQLFRNEVDYPKLSRKNKKKFHKELDKMKVDRYYDISCDRCGKSVCRYFHKKYFLNVYEARYVAYKLGFRYDEKHNGIFCKNCLALFNKENNNDDIK